MTAALEKSMANLRTLIEAVAAERPEVPQEDVALLDDQERELLVQKKLTTRGVLVRTTYAELVAVGVTPGAAKVLKLLFPVPAEGAGSAGGADASGGSAEVAKQLREARREQRRMRHLLEQQKHVLEQQKHMLEQHLGFLSFGPTGSSHPKTSVYKPMSFETYCGGDWDQATQLRCLLTGRLYPADSVVAAHIFRHQWKDRAALVKAGIDIDGPANVIPCQRNVEKNLDLMRLTIEPTAPGQFTVKIMDPVLFTSDHQYIVDKKDGWRWSDIHNKEVDFTFRDFGTQGPPLSALVCAIHMRSAIRTAENYTWIPQKSVKLPKWAQGLLTSPTGILEGYLRSAAQSAEASASGTGSSTSSPAGTEARSI